MLSEFWAVYSTTITPHANPIKKKLKTRILSIIIARTYSPTPLQCKRQINMLIRNRFSVYKFGLMNEAHFQLKNKFCFFLFWVKIWAEMVAIGIAVALFWVTETLPELILCQFYQIVMLLWPFCKNRHFCFVKTISKVLGPWNLVYLFWDEGRLADWRGEFHKILMWIWTIINLGISVLLKDVSKHTGARTLKIGTCISFFLWGLVLLFEFW